MSDAMNARNVRKTEVVGSTVMVGRNGSVANPHLWKKTLMFFSPFIGTAKLIKFCVRSAYRWIGVGRADEYEDLARQYRACRIGIDTCTESLRDDDQP